MLCRVQPTSPAMSLVGPHSRRNQGLMVIERGICKTQKTSSTGGQRLAGGAASMVQPTWSKAWRLFQDKHSLKSNSGPVCGFGRNSDQVHGCSPGQVLEAPRQVGQIDPVHCGAHTDHGGKKMDGLVGVLGCEPVDQAELGPDGPARAGGGPFDGLDVRHYVPDRSAPPGVVPRKLGPGNTRQPDQRCVRNRKLGQNCS